MITHKVRWLLLYILPFAACQSGETANEHTQQYQDSLQKEHDNATKPVPAPVNVTWPPLSYLQLTPEMGLGYDSVTIEDHCSNYHVKFLYAKTGPDAGRINTALYHKPDRAGIRSELIEDGKTFLKSALDEMIASGDTTKPDWPFCQEESNNDMLVFWNKKYLCIETNSYLYMGGAHGMHADHYTLVDISAGKIVDPGTWIRDTTHLLNIARTLLKKYPQGETEGNGDLSNLELTLEDNGFFVTGDELPMPGSIGVCPEGVIFQYDPYEINAYAMGSYTLVLPWEAVGNAFDQAFLKPLIPH